MLGNFTAPDRLLVTQCPRERRARLPSCGEHDVLPLVTIKVRQKLEGFLRWLHMIHLLPFNFISKRQRVLKPSEQVKLKQKAKF